MTNVLSHPYQMDESTSIFKGSGSDFSFLFHIAMKFMSANRIAPDGTPRYSVCLCPIKRMPGLYGLKSTASSLAYLLNISVS